MVAGEPIGAHERNRLLQSVTLPVAIAVSGGPDSMALMHLVAVWAKMRQELSGAVAGSPPILVVTVDHSLRPQSADEAEWVAAEARRLGLPHITLRWAGPKPTTGIQEAARKARFERLMELAGSEELPRPREILLAHHLDDQAETLLMRLARGSGVDGLSAMREAETRVWLRLAHPVEERPVTFRRPLLGVPKRRLVATLDAAGAPYLRDPSNDEARFERVRLRAAAPYLDGLGLAADQLATTARRLGMARAALEDAQHRLARSAVGLHDDAYASLDLAQLRAAPAEVALRVVQSLVEAFGGRETPPRRLQLEALHRRLVAFGPVAATLAGTAFEPAPLGLPAVPSNRDILLVYREPGRRGLPGRRLKPGQGLFWDRRFYVSLSAACEGAVEIGPLGGEFARLKRLFPALAALKIPLRAAATLPAAWLDGRLLAVPTLGRLVPELMGPPHGSEYALAVRFAAQHTAAIWGEAVSRSPM